MMAESRRSISSSDPSYWAYFELFQGNVDPLVQHLRSEEPIHPLIRDALADMLDRKKGAPRLSLVLRKQGRPKRTVGDEKLDAEIAAFVKSQPGPQKAAWVPAAKKFGVTIEYASDAVERQSAKMKRFKRFLAAHGLPVERAEES